MLAAVQRLGASGVGHIPALARADAMFAMRALRCSPSVSSATAASPPAPSGRLFGAIVLERYPVIMAELPKWERDFMVRMEPCPRHFQPASTTRSKP
jgi:hypothetical protein